MDKLSQVPLKSDLVRTELKFKNFATLEQLSEIESRLYPLLTACDSELQGYRQDNIDSKEAIVTFDKVLSLKTDKITVYELRKWIEN